MARRTKSPVPGSLAFPSLAEILHAPAAKPPKSPKAPRSTDFFPADDGPEAGAKPFTGEIKVVETTTLGELARKARDYKPLSEMGPVAAAEEKQALADASEREQDRADVQEGQSQASSRSARATAVRRALSAASRAPGVLSGCVFQVRRTYLPTEPGEPNVFAVAVTYVFPVEGHGDDLGIGRAVEAIGAEAGVPVLECKRVESFKRAEESETAEAET